MRNTHSKQLHTIDAVTLAAIACLLLMTTPAQAAQDFPTRPLRVVVSEGAGAGSDIIARQIGIMLTEAWGQPAIVENKPGASGLIGAEAVAKAPADGHTLWVFSTSQLMGTTMHQRYMLPEEFAPVTLYATTTSIMAVNAALPINNIPELIAYAKARPGQLLYGSAGQGTGMHLCMELFSTMTGIKASHVPYKGAPQMLADFAGGQLQFSCVPTAPLQALLKGGRVRALGVTMQTRTALAPGLPPVSDTVPGFESLGWYGAAAAPGTPAEIVNQLNAVIVKGLKNTVLQERLNALGAEAAGNTPAEFTSFLKAQTTKWAKVLRDANIKPTD